MYPSLSFFVFVTKTILKQVRDYRIFDLATMRTPRNLLREGEKGYETAKKWMDIFNAASIEAAKVGTKKEETKVQDGGVDPWSQVKFGNTTKVDDEDGDSTKKDDGDDDSKQDDEKKVQVKSPTTISMFAGGICNCSYIWRSFRSGDFQKVGIFSAWIRGGATEGDYILSLTFFVGFLSALGYSIMASLAAESWYVSPLYLPSEITE